MSDIQTTEIPATDSFSAGITLHDAQVYINVTTLDALLKTLAQFGYPMPPGAIVGKADPKPVGVKVESKKEAAVQVEKPASSESAPRSSPASSSQPSTVSDEAARPTYDSVKAAVLTLAKVSPQLAKDTLAKFTGQNGQPCDHGTKLKLEDYPAFLAAADAARGVAA